MRRFPLTPGHHLPLVFRQFDQRLSFEIALERFTGGLQEKRVGFPVVHDQIAVDKFAGYSQRQLPISYATVVHDDRLLGGSPGGGDGQAAELVVNDLVILENVERVCPVLASDRNTDDAYSGR